MLSGEDLFAFQLQLPDAPLALAYSGGGDSTALLDLLKDRSPRPAVLIVDHGLRDGSADEARQAASMARGMGCHPEVLTWDHPKGRPKTAIQEKARKARYGLLGAACRAKGIRFLVTAHTRDDQAETLLQRYDRHTDWRGAAGMRTVTYAPLWPELTDVYLLRPLLHVSRQSLRDHNRFVELNWIEDPSNQNRSFSRIRARDFLKTREGLAQELLATALDLQAGRDQERVAETEFLQRFAKVDEWGVIHLRKVPNSHLLGQLCSMAAGTGGVVAAEKSQSLRVKMRESEFVSATLGGAICVNHKNEFQIGAAPSTYKGRHNKPGLRPISLRPRQSVIWDGRFKMTAAEPGLTVLPLGVRKDLLSESQYDLLKIVHPAIRGSLPVVVTAGSDIVAAPGNYKNQAVEVISLVKDRMEREWGTEIA